MKKKRIYDKEYGWCRITTIKDVSKEEAAAWKRQGIISTAEPEVPKPVLIVKDWPALIREWNRLAAKVLKRKETV